MGHKEIGSRLVDFTREEFVYFPVVRVLRCGFDDVSIVHGRQVLRLGSPAKQSAPGAAIGADIFSAVTLRWAVVVSAAFAATGVTWSSTHRYKKDDTLRGNRQPGQLPDARYRRSY